MWVRGLKLSHLNINNMEYKVAPHVGAWIETLELNCICSRAIWSHPMWVRGLKPQIRHED